MSNQSKRTASESGSESDGESDEEETTKEKVVLKPQGPAKPEEDDEEDDEEFETDSDDDAGTQHDSVHKVVRQGPAVKNAAGEHPAGKRGRELNGAKVGSMEEPANKKRKETKDDKSRVQALKSASPPKGAKADPAKTTRSTVAGRGEKARPGPGVKADSGQGQAAARKAKPGPTQAAANSRQPAPKVGADKTSPQKAKKTAHWSTNLEVSLANLMYGDIKKTGRVMPVSRQDGYWGTLLNRLPLEGEMTELQVVDKVKRMRNRYHFLARKVKEEGVRTSHFKNNHEEKLFQLWDGVWGGGSGATGRGPVGAHAASDDDSSDDESAEAGAPSRDMSKSVAGRQESEESSSDEEEDQANARRKTAGLNQINASGKPPPTITPFVSKPRLEFTPMVRMDKRKAAFKDNEEMPSGDHHTGEVLGKDDGNMHSEFMRRVRADTSSMFREFRLQLLDEFRSDRIGALGGLGSRLGEFGGLEGLSSAQTSQLRKDWRDYRVKEISLQTEKMELLIREMRIEQELLKSRAVA